MEIFTDRDELMLKKYSPIASLEKFSESTAKSLNDVTGHLAIICDTDEVLCAFGSGKREVAGKSVSSKLDKIMRDRKSYVANLAEGGDVVPICDGEESSVTAQIIVPIVTNGDCLGAVALVSFDDGAKMEANACKLAQLSASIIANQFD
jgi:AbrB family transcriptional regulator (stage V sporulation protein T)